MFTKNACKVVFGLIPSLLVDFLTVLVTIFVAELTDKDALLLLALATRIKPWTAFASGSVAFTITTTIIVSIGYVLTQFVPVMFIKVAGGFVMIGFAIYGYLSERREENRALTEEQRLQERAKRSAWRIFLGAVGMLMVLDLAGDATEVLTIVYVARFQNVLLVFFGCVTALVAASAVETMIGNRLGKALSVSTIRYMSLAIFLIIGSVIIVTTVFPGLIPFLS